MYIAAQMFITWVTRPATRGQTTISGYTTRTIRGYMISTTAHTSYFWAPSIFVE